MKQLILDVPVTDIERTVEFYRDVLGFELVVVRGRGERMQAHLRAGHVDIMFRSRRAPGSEDEPPEPLDGPVWRLLVDDVEAWHRRVCSGAYPVSIVRPFTSTLFGPGEFIIEDVDGQVIIVSQPAPVAPAETPPSVT